MSPKETFILYAKVIYSQRKMCYFFISTKGITQMKNKKKSISKCQVSLVAQPLSDKVTRIFQNVINLGFFSHHKTGEVIDSIHRFSLASSITIFTRESQRVKVRGKSVFLFYSFLFLYDFPYLFTTVYLFPNLEIRIFSFTAEACNDVYTFEIELCFLCIYYM